MKNIAYKGDAMETRKTCVNCGAVIKNERASRFCCRKCWREYWRNHGKVHREPLPGEPIIREFRCRECGRHVAVVEKRDQRSVFCSQTCEKRYWRYVSKYKDHGRGGGNLGMSGGMSLGSLIRREAMDLR